jgi:hypothetical protein
MTKIKMKKTQAIDEGKHTGVITAFVESESESEYHYVDCYIMLDEYPEIDNFKVGFNRNLSEVSELGKFLKKAGFELIEEQEYMIKDMANFLQGMKLELQTFNNDEGFARVLKDTIKFLK